MSFFEPLPPPPPESVREWSSPAWDRPSEGTLPAIVPVSEIVHRGDNVVVELEQLRVYPNGFTINLIILTNPHLGHERASLGMLGGGGWIRVSGFPALASVSPTAALPGARRSFRAISASPRMTEVFRPSPSSG
jgi:hypothetical protein